MDKLKFGSRAVFMELEDFAKDQELVEAVQATVEAQKKGAYPKLREIFRPKDDAEREVSKEALDRLLRVNVDISGIRSRRDISNVIIFNDARYENAVFSEEIRRTRERVDRIVDLRLRSLFEDERKLNVYPSGFFLYPPKGYMGWHTNTETPGWRFYVNCSDEPGRSFIRYRNPYSGEIVTSWDKTMSFRLFRVTRENPIWHAVWSGTNRFSLGFRIHEKPWILERLRGKLSRALNAWRHVRA